MQLNEKMDDEGFNRLLCPLFGMYSRMQQTLLSLLENDERHHNVSLLTFLFERETGAVCERVSISYTTVHVS